MSQQAPRSNPRRRFPRTAIHDKPSEASLGESSPTAAAVAVDSPPANPIEVVVDGHSREGLGFSFKVLASGALFRCQPVRHPQQPRFWCVSIYHCFTGGSADETQLRWVSDAFLTREELPEAVAAIRSNLAGWLTDASRRDLYDWMLTRVSRSPLSQEMKYGEKATVSKA